MANYQSIIRRQQPYIKPYDVQDIEKTLAVKEGRYNANVAQINQAISQFASIDLIRDKDREYLYNNLKRVIDIVDDTDNIDFSRTGLGTDLGMYISQAVDKNVIKQAKNTQAIRSYNTGLETLKEENPELYSNVNDYDARVQAGYFDYLSGSTDKLGNLDYVNYTDVQSNLLKKAKELKDLHPKKSIKVPTGDGYFIEKTIDGLTQSEWLQVLPSMLTDNDQKQLEINGRNQYRYNDAAAVADLERIKSNNKVALDKSLKSINARIDLVADEATKQKLRQEKRQLTDYFNKTNSTFDLLGQSAGEIGSYLIRNELINDLASSLGATEQIKYSVDNSYWKKIKQEAEEREKLVGKNGQFNSFADRNKDLSPDIQTTATAVNTEDIGSILKKKEDVQKNFEDNFNRKLSTIYNSMTPADRGRVDSIEQDILKKHSLEMQKDPTLKPLTDLELHRQVIDLVSNGDNSIISLAQKIELKSDMDKIDAFNRAKSNAFLQAEEMLFVKNAEEFYEELTSNKNIRLLGNSKDLTFNNFFENKNIKNAEDFISFLGTNSEEAKLIKANFLLQTIEQIPQFANFLTQKEIYNVPLDVSSSATTYSRDLKRRLVRASELLGESKNIEDIFRFKSYVSNEEVPLEELKEGDFITFEIKDKNSKVADILLNTSHLYGTTWTDHTLRQESHIAREITQDKFTEEYERALNLASANITGQNIITIQPSGTRKGEAVPEYQDLITKAQPLGLVGIDKKLPINLSKNVDGTFTIFQNQDSKDPDNPVRTRLGIISKEELQSLPNLSQSIKLNENKENIDFQTEVRSEVPTLNYLSSSSRNAANLSEIYDINTEQGYKKIIMSSIGNERGEGGVIEYLSKTPSLKGLNEKQKSSDYLSMVKKVMSNPNKFSIRMDSYKGFSNVVIEMTDSRGEKTKIDSINISNGINQREFMDMYYATPQIFLTLALENIGNNYIRTNDSSKIDLINNNL